MSWKKSTLVKRSLHIFTKWHSFLCVPLPFNGRQSWAEQTQLSHQKQKRSDYRLHRGQVFHTALSQNAGKPPPFFFFLCHSKGRKIAAVTTAFHLVTLVCLFCHSSGNAKERVVREFLWGTFFFFFCWGGGDGEGWWDNVILFYSTTIKEGRHCAEKDKLAVPWQRDIGINRLTVANLTVTILICYCSASPLFYYFHSSKLWGRSVSVCVCVSYLKLSCVL